MTVELLGLLRDLGEHWHTHFGRVLVGRKLQGTPAGFQKHGQSVETTRRRVHIPVGDERNPEGPPIALHQPSRTSVRPALSRSASWSGNAWVTPATRGMGMPRRPSSARQLLDEDALSGRELGSSVRPDGTPAARRVGARDADAHRRAALEADQHDVLAYAHLGGDRSGDRRRQPLAVPAVRQGVVLFAHGPETVDTRECQLRARHLFDAPTLGPENLHDGRIHALGLSAAFYFGVLI